MTLKKKKKPSAWQGSDDDAIKLAAIRWFACAIEMEAIQIYATDRRKYTDIEEAMGDCIDAIHELRKKLTIGDEEECPPGYTMCAGECAPRCPEAENQ